MFPLMHAYSMGFAVPCRFHMFAPYCSQRTLPELPRFELTTLLAAYVLSRNYGNDSGLFDALNHNDLPNSTGAFDDPINPRGNATGRHPNDRTRVFKGSGSYRLTRRLVVGMFFVVESGVSLIFGYQRARPILDLSHIAGQRQAVDIDQICGFLDTTSGTLYPYTTDSR
jgi:hypothetical protein